MVKLSVITRTEKDSQRETKDDIHKVHRTLNRSDHPLSQVREYQRAVIASKITKIFAKPFLYSMNNHSDGISCFSKAYNNLDRIASGSFDGNVIVWDLISRKPYCELNCFETSTKGVSIFPDGDFLLTAGDDNLVKLFDIRLSRESWLNNLQNESIEKFITAGSLYSIDLSFSNTRFVTSGEKVEVWDLNKSAAVNKFSWGSDTIIKVKINPVEQDLILCSGIDRGVFVHDIRSRKNVVKATLVNKSAALSWNPMEPFNFIVGNEDSNVYTFDMRKMDKAKMIHKDHIGAVLDVDFSPTGREFVSGSFDKTIRIFPYNQGKSREIYHGKRMQKVWSVLWTLDNNYVISGSEDTNIRVWKAISHKKVGNYNDREKNAFNYREKLIKKFKYNKEIKKIKKSHLPKYIKNASRKAHIMRESKYRKGENMKINNEEIYEEPEAERRRKVIKKE